MRVRLNSQARPCGSKESTATLKFILLPSTRGYKQQPSQTYLNDPQSNTATIMLKALGYYNRPQQCCRSQEASYVKCMHIACCDGSKPDAITRPAQSKYFLSPMALLPWQNPEMDAHVLQAMDDVDAWAPLTENIDVL